MKIQIECGRCSHLIKGFESAYCSGCVSQVDDCAHCGSELTSEDDHLQIDGACFCMDCAPFNPALQPTRRKELLFLSGNMHRDLDRIVDAAYAAGQETMRKRVLDLAAEMIVGGDLLEAVNRLELIQKEEGP